MGRTRRIPLLRKSCYKGRVLAMPLFRIFAGCMLLALPAIAQSPSANGRAVEFGHIHLNSADPDSAIAFWQDVIGAAPYSHATLRGVSMIGAIILFTGK